VSEDNESNESGTALRAKLEAALAENKALRTTAATTVAQTFKYVKPEDLAEVAPDQIAVKAQEIEAARTADAEALVKKFLADRGVAEGDLAKPEPAAAGAGALIASLGSLGGQPITPSIVPEGAFGEDRIRAALS
jgi:mannitol-1-phosphate/altronate dehydrogenase